MPDLLREQFPYFRPIVEAFGYRNLEFEGWEADDVIATLATRADEAGVKTAIVSTDRDAFQLVSDNVTLMMTPRGVADVNVYTPERVEARYGITPAQIPDFIGLKGDTSDNIPGVPGIGDKTAGQLIAQYGSLEEVLEHADELSPARSKAIREHADQARTAKQLATMRRDLELDFDPAELVALAARPLRARGDVPPLRVPQPAEPRRRARRGRARRRADASRAIADAVARGADAARDAGPVGVAADEATASRWRPATRSSSSTRGRRAVDGELVVHDAKALRRRPRRDDTLLAAYLIEPGRATYELDDLAAEYDVDVVPEPATEEETAALVRHAAHPAAADRDSCATRVRERGAERLYREVELPLTGVLAAMEDAGVKHRHVPHGRDHRAARRPRRGARGEGVRPRGRGVRARLDRSRSGASSSRSSG